MTGMSRDADRVIAPGPRADRESEAVGGGRYRNRGNVSRAMVPTEEHRVQTPAAEPIQWAYRTGQAGYYPVDQHILTVP